MKNKYIMNMLTIVIAFALVISGVYSLLSWSIYSSAGATDCNEARQSWYYCDPSRYLAQLVFWCSCFALLLVLAIVFARMQLKNTKTKK